MPPSPLSKFTSLAADAGLFLDFDGTLSEIVDVPSEARPLAGAPEVLADLARSLKVVAVVSGRSAHQLLEWLGPDVEIWGLHGAQRTRNGEVVLADAAVPYQDLLAGVHAEAESELARSGLQGVILEDKGVMVTFHYRTAQDPVRAEQVIDELVGRLATKYGLKRNFGKLAMELQPPVSFSKRDVVLERTRAEGLKAVCFAGDDIVDLPGYDALDELEGEGLMTLRVAVDSAESPEPLIERADLVVGSPGEMLDLLRGMA
jgi:trehalose 6-phosphate phosphatase